MPTEISYDKIRKLLANPKSTSADIKEEIDQIQVREQNLGEQKPIKDHAHHYHTTILILAIAYKRFEVLEYIHKKLSEPLDYQTADGLNAYRLACAYGENSPPAVFLRGKGLGAKDKLYNPLEEALLEGDLNAVKVAVQGGQKIDIRRLNKFEENGQRNPFYDDLFVQSISNPVRLDAILNREKIDPDYTKAILKFKLEVAINAGEIKEINQLVALGFKIDHTRIMPYYNGEPNKFFDHQYRDALRKPGIANALLAGVDRESEYKEALKSLEIEAAVVTGNVKEIQRLAKLGYQIDTHTITKFTGDTELIKNRIEPKFNKFYDSDFSSKVQQPHILEALLSSDKLKSDYVQFLRALKLSETKVVIDPSLGTAEGPKKDLHELRGLIQKRVKPPVEAKELPSQKLQEVQQLIQEQLASIEANSKLLSKPIPNRENAIANFKTRLEALLKENSAFDTVNGTNVQAIQQAITKFVAIDKELIQKYNHNQAEEKDVLVNESKKLVEDYYKAQAELIQNYQKQLPFFADDLQFDFDDFQRKFKNLEKNQAELKEQYDKIGKIPKSDNPVIQQDITKLKEQATAIIQNAGTSSAEKLNQVKAAIHAFIEPVTITLAEEKVSTTIREERNKAKEFAETKINAVSKRDIVQRDKLQKEFKDLDNLAIALSKIKDQYMKTDKAQRVNEISSDMPRFIYQMYYNYKGKEQLKPQEIGKVIFQRLNIILQEKAQEHNSVLNRAGRAISEKFGATPKPEPQLNSIIGGVMAEFPDYAAEKPQGSISSQRSPSPARQ